eukprot:GCRY01000997.1.p1 GENE.GCRY01000997.1~~GCRY01000997.1.p1  ORF type:complete len:592 (+),score=204.23 GCRY01000997.1:155-1930(+)
MESFEGLLGDLDPSDLQPEEPQIDELSFEERGFNDEELETCIKVLRCITKQVGWIKRDEFRELRRHGKIFVDGFENRPFNGLDFTKYEQRKFLKQRRKIKRQQMDQLQKKKIESAALRQQRIGALEALVEGEADDSNPNSIFFEQPCIEDAKPATSTLDTVEQSLQKIVVDENEEDLSLLMKPRTCYICKSHFYVLHHFYCTLCQACAELNWQKRNQTANLNGMVAMVTGARVKIGYETSLKLLRAGALVIATTRFPHNAVDRYAEEKDYDQWKDRLHIYGMDLRDLQGVEAFCTFIKTHYHALHIIVNNAAQTVRRPPQYYHHLMEKELQPSSLLPPTAQQHLAPFGGSGANIHAPEMVLKLMSTSEAGPATALLSPQDQNHSPAPVDVTNRSAALSQLILMEGDEDNTNAHFPEGVYDVTGQQVDLRSKNSWQMKADEVNTAELVEVHAINALGPYILNARLRELMQQSPDDGRGKYIINVSAMEAKFYRFKSPNHPHTNMAKAALNMLTRTSAQDYQSDGIFMNSVDTGWITDENDFRTKAKNFHRGFQCPIDEVDAAARLLDPVFSGVNGEERLFGKFLKDYRDSEW